MRNFGPLFRWIPKKRSSPHSGSISVRYFGSRLLSWVPSEHLLTKKLRGPDIFCPLQCQAREGTGPLEIDAGGNNYFAKKRTIFRFRLNFKVSIFFFFDETKVIIASNDTINEKLYRWIKLMAHWMQTTSNHLQAYSSRRVGFFQCFALVTTFRH